MHPFESRFQELTSQKYNIDVKSLLTRSWVLFTPHAKSFIAITIIMVIIFLLLTQVPIVGPFISQLIAYIITAGIYLYALKVIRHQEVKFEEFFKGMPFTLTIILSSLISGFLILLGAIIIIPAIYLCVAYTFSILFIIDKKMNAWESLEYSRKIITMQWFSFLWLFIILALIMTLGALCLGVGLLIAVPYISFVIALCYSDIIDKKERSNLP